jgi:hypothetical protein
VEKEVVDHLELAEEGLREAAGMMVHRLKVGVEEVGGHPAGMMVHLLKVGVEEVGGHLDLAEEGLREAGGMISSAH